MEFFEVPIESEEGFFRGINELEYLGLLSIAKTLWGNDVQYSFHSTGYLGEGDLLGIYKQDIDGNDIVGLVVSKYDSIYIVVHDENSNAIYYKVKYC